MDTIYVVKVWSNGKDGSYIFAKAFTWNPSREDVRDAVEASYENVALTPERRERVDVAIDHVMEGNFESTPYSVVTR